MQEWEMIQVYIWGEVLGGHGEEVCNENGKRLLQFSSEHNLWISNTWFPHKRIHKFTWECRGRKLRTLIDYFPKPKPKQLYSDAKLEAKKVVRNAKNEEWMQLSKELKKDARANQRKVWARINESRRP